MCPGERGCPPPTPGSPMSPGSSSEHPNPTPGGTRGESRLPTPALVHLLCDVVVTGVDAVPEQVLGAAVAAAKVAAVHELPGGAGWGGNACLCMSCGWGGEGLSGCRGLGETGVQTQPMG